MKSKIFIVNGEKKVGKIIGKTEGFYIIEFDWNAKNYIKPDGTLLSPNEDFKEVYKFIDGIAKIERKSGDKYNFIKTDGTFLSTIDFFFVEEFKEGFSAVEKTFGICNYIKKDGTFLSPNEDFYECWNFDNGLGIVKRKNGLYNYIKTDGTFVSPNEDFVDVNYFQGEFAEVTITRKINKQGNIIM